MDLSVQAAMAKWPDVPVIFGWLRLDARGQWWLHDDRLRHPRMEAFFQRNYARDDQGRYFVQNGPQKVYVGLESAPFVARRQAGGWSAHPGGVTRMARAAYITPDGQLLLELDGELALVDDRDLMALVDQVLPGWDGALSTVPDRLPLPEREVPLCVETLPRLWARYGVVVEPSAG